MSHKLFSILQMGTFTLDGQSYLIKPYSAGMNGSDQYNQSAQSIPHLIYSLKHSQNHNHSETHCSMDLGKSVSIS